MVPNIPLTSANIFQTLGKKCSALRLLRDKNHVNSNNTEYANIILSNALEFIVDRNIKDNKLNVNYGIDEAFRNTGGGNSESAPEIYTIDSINLS